jgi:hypothetical protein
MCFIWSTGSGESTRLEVGHLEGSVLPLPEDVVTKYCHRSTTVSELSCSFHKGSSGVLDVVEGFMIVNVVTDYKKPFRSKLSVLLRTSI